MINQNTIPSEIQSIPTHKVTDLDVRPILDAGGEPFSSIMSAITKTLPDGALKLRTTFKPAPLFHALGSQGWQHWIEQGEGNDWIVWFYRPKEHQDGVIFEKIEKNELNATYLQKEHPELQTRLKTDGNTWYLDVRTLPPPEPMELTLTVLEKLPKGTSLIQINERNPQFLLPILLERGFEFKITQDKESEVLLKIRWIESR